MIETLNFAYGPPKSFGQIKYIPEDFCVEEQLGFDLTGSGEHLFILMEKQCLNTEDMAKIIARELGIPLKTVSYAGLKDKFAKTTQWFSVHLPGINDPSLGCLTNANYRVIKSIRHNKKLRIGALKSNRFTIKIHNSEIDEKDISMRMERIKTQGVPNYFGAQRFGNNGNNLVHAKEILLANKKVKSPHLRGIYYSAARSFLFNQILSLRIIEECWNQPLNGDLMMLAGSHSVFHIDTVDDEIMQRIKEHDIYAAAPLWGTGKELLTDKALQIQQQALEPWNDWCVALEQHGLQKMYRSMVLLPEDLHYQDSVFSFTLPTGSFATMLLREFLVDNA